jgi:hypothetical protein
MKEVKTNQIVGAALIISALGSIILGGFWFNEVVLAKQPEEAAYEECAPYNLKIENITNDSFTVVWETEGECMGGVEVVAGDESFSDIFKTDDLDNTHEVEVSYLKAGRSYGITVISNNQEYTSENSDLKVTTKQF